MNRVVPGLLAVLTLLIFASSAGAVAPRAEQAAAWDALLERHSGRLSMRWDEERGSPRTIAKTDLARRATGVVRAVLSRDQALARGQAFFSENAALFGIRTGLDAMTLTSAKESEGRTHMRFEQTYRGVPVEDGGYTLTYEADGSFGMLNGRMVQRIDVRTTPVVSSERAERSALVALELGSSRAASPPHLRIIVESSGRARLMWAVSVVAPEGPGAWRVLVDAQSGRVTATQDELVYEGVPLRTTGTRSGALGGLKQPVNPANPQEVDEGGGGGGGGGGSGCNSASGNIYSNHVCTAASSSYLPRLTSGNYTIGQYVSSQPDSRRASCRANDPTGCSQHHYTPPDPHGGGYDETGFDDVNVYYHLDKMLYDFWDWKLGFRYKDVNNNYIPVEAITHSYAPALTVQADTVVHWGNAAYNPITKKVYFGDGNQGFENGFPPVFDPAKIANTIYHELGHLVLRELGINTGASSPAWTDAVHEGMADYFAASFVGNPAANSCVFKAPHQNEVIRPLNTQSSVFNYLNTGLTYTYPGGIVRDRTYEHTEGMILSGTMWDMRSNIGAAVVDVMAYKACDYVYTNCNFFDLRDAFYYIDQTHFFGDHHCDIQLAFWLRGMDIAPPDATNPTYVTATDNGCTVVVSWSGSTNENGHRVYKNGIDVSGDRPRGFGEWEDPSPSSTPVLYTVKAFNCRMETTGRSDYGSTASPPAAPAGLTATPGTCTVNLSWTAVPGATGYRIYRNGAFLKDVSSNSGSDTDPPLASSNYSVASTICSGNVIGPASGTVPGQPNPVLLAPAVDARDGESQTSIRVTWTAVAGATGYRVYRGTTLIYTWTGGSLEYIDAAAPAGIVTYAVAGTACTPAKDGPKGTDTGYRKLLVTIAGPTSRSAYQSGTWTVTPTGAAPYTYAWYKYRDCDELEGPAMVASSGGGELLEATCFEWHPVGTNSPTLTASDRFDFRVKCVVTDAAGNTAFAQRNVDIPTAMGSPQPAVSSLTATDGVVNINKVQITWGPSDGAEGFRVYRAGTLIYTGAQNDRSYTDPTAPNAISQYCVVAYSGTKNSSYVCDNGYPYVPLTGTVSGPGQLNYNGSGTYTLSLTSGGIPPLTRQWYFAAHCDGGPYDPAPAGLQESGGGPILNIPPCDEEYPVYNGTGTSISWTGTYDVELSCRVTDAAGRTIQPYKIVDVLGVAPNALDGDREQSALLASDLPTRTELLPGTNPARGLTDVSFTLAEPLRVSLVVFDIAGRRIEQLAASEMPRGRHRISWNAGRHPAGMYVYRFTAGGVTSTRRFMLVR